MPDIKFAGGERVPKHPKPADAGKSVAPRSSGTLVKLKERCSVKLRERCRVIPGTRRVSTGRNGDDGRRRFCRFLPATR
jgi:hypothetical protein